jgi:beta-hydroxylase
MKSAIRNAFVAAGAKTIRSLEQLMARQSEVGNPAFFDPDIFPWRREFESQWRTIRSELEQVLPQKDRLPNFQDISRDQRHLSQDDRWKTYFFYALGQKAATGTERCPETLRIIESLPGMQTAFFSILAPGKRIPPHRGAFKGVIRYHLGLIVPEPRERCWIRVGSEVRHWGEGESLVFDDTYEHEVHNDTDGWRAVLFLDIVRPLRFPANALNATVLRAVRASPFVQDGVQNYRAWEAKLDQATPTSAT